MMLNREKTIQLIEELHQAAALYYQELEEQIMSDEDYDAKVEVLKLIHQAGEHPDLFTHDSKGYSLLETTVASGTTVAPVAGDSIVKHAIPMLSLDKANEEAQVEKFLDKARAAGATDFRLQAKLDGFALSAKYENGCLSVLATRGNGVEGEDITYLASSTEVAIQGLPKKISTKENIEVRGELYLTNDQFRAADAARLAAQGGAPYSLSRNALVGIVKKAKKGTGYQAEISFAAYSLVKNNKPAELEETPTGIQTVNHITSELAPTVKLTGYTDNKDVFKGVQAFGKARDNFTIPTDGVVIKPTNEVAMHESMGFGSSAPKSQIAFKYPSPTAVTKLLGVDLTVGKTGKITPVGRVEEVLLDGSKISNLSLHNFNLVREKNIRVGQTVVIFKANEIIPQIKSVVSTPDDAVEIPVPDECPSCAAKLKASKEDAGLWPPRTLLCPNLDCDAREFAGLKVAVGKNYLDIDGLSEQLLSHLYEIGRVANIADLYTLTFDELKDAHFGEAKTGKGVRLGENRAAHILEQIEESKTRPIHRVIPALNIAGLGRTFSKQLAKRFTDMDGIMAASLEDIASMPNMGDSRPAAIWNGLQHRRELIEALQERGVQFATEGAAADAKLKGLSFAISGAVPAPFSNRNKWVEFVEANGGEFHSGPKAITSFMVGDKNESSSKIKKAVSLGLEFLTAEEFTQRYSS